MSQRANLIDQLNALEIFRAVFRRNEEWALYADHCRMLAGVGEELAKLETAEQPKEPHDTPL